jgi:hypothetical protein
MISFVLSCLHLTGFPTPLALTLNQLSMLSVMSCIDLCFFIYPISISMILHSLRCSLVTFEKYCSPKRKIRIKYGVLIKVPQAACNIQQLERVQRKFLKFLSFSFHFPCAPHEYTPVVSLLGLSSLADRRYSAVIPFLNGL